jgi:type II secretory ATPase GspE/PulE/Tfp pilus assembly ATPase PilB-like protein
VDPGYLRKIGFPAQDIASTTFYKGTGCEECRMLGYQGRQGIHELLVVTEALRPLVMQRAPASNIAMKAMEGGMRNLRMDGWHKVKKGITTLEEVLRVTQSEEHMKSLVDDSRTEVWVKS